MAKGSSDETALLPDVTGEIDRIWAEVCRLPRRQAQVITLIYIEDMSLSEIADTLDVSKDTVNTHIRRARQTLASRLGLEDA
ncbi:MAG: sigma-70 region 4 domain-containing protein [Actinobacteria bacterium]|nr:sigma-70 region 4 domain-containing protein [Actinomycetota bacterium]